MGYANDEGYTPRTIEELMLSVMENVNEQFGTTYTEETFIGTNFYKYFYALMQSVQLNEVKTSEIFLKLQQYIEITNEKISRPVVTNPGLVEIIEDAGYLASVKPMIDEDAGKIHICVDKEVEGEDPWEDTDDYDDDKLEVCTIIKDSTVAGCVTQGTESESLTLSNGQSFDFKYNLPDRILVYLKLTLTLSDNNQVLVGNPDDVRLALFANIKERYRLGKNFEPERYFGVEDAPWASVVKLEWSLDEESYTEDVFEAEYDELFDIDLARISIVED